MLAEERGLRKTWPSENQSLSQSPLEIEVEGPIDFTDCPHCASRNHHQHWIGRLPSVPGVECIGVSESDAFNGVKIRALQRMAELTQRGWEVPEPVETWFTLTRTT